MSVVGFSGVCGVSVCLVVWYFSFHDMVVRLYLASFKHQSAQKHFRVMLALEMLVGNASLR